MNKHLILTICVNYHNDEETVRYVQSLLSQRGNFEQKVIVIDNSEPPLADSPLYKLGLNSPQIRLCRPEKNLGYYGGAARGLREYLKEFPLPEWIIVCNTDMEFIQDDFLSNLCAFHPESQYAVIAPAIISSVSGRDQNPYMRARPTRFRMHLYKWTFRYYLTFMLYQILSLLKNKFLFILNRVYARSNANLDEKPFIPEKIYAPHGSFVTFNQKYFESGGTINHGVFLFGEEIFIAETTRRLGLTIIYDPRLQILHHEHATHNFKSQKIFGFVKKAAQYCADVFFSKNSQNAQFFERG